MNFLPALYECLHVNNPSEFGGESYKAMTGQLLRSMRISTLVRDVTPDFFEEPETFPERFLENKFGAKPAADIKDIRGNFGFLPRQGEFF